MEVVGCQSSQKSWYDDLNLPGSTFLCLPATSDKRGYPGNIFP